MKNLLNFFEKTEANFDTFQHCKLEATDIVKGGVDIVIYEDLSSM